MLRRYFIALFGGAAITWPLAARAQPTVLRVVGFLNSASADGYAVMADAFKQGLKETRPCGRSEHSDRISLGG
jgi:putative ABC transport system substrate-binding protein